MALVLIDLLMMLAVSEKVVSIPHERWLWNVLGSNEHTPSNILLSRIHSRRNREGLMSFGRRQCHNHGSTVENDVNGDSLHPSPSVTRTKTMEQRRRLVLEGERCSWLECQLDMSLRNKRRCRGPCDFVILSRKRRD
ncbi:hypothetical protein PM082_007286 [Marasmius tenuissimus]|nr:hypothetical protein PM082_007286 [Marasmius tenuissimus]